MLKQYFIIVDTETTQDGMVADFGAVVVDRKGNIVAQCAILVRDIYTDPEKHPLFFTSDPSGIWSKTGQDKRYQMYTQMLDSGTRMIASVSAINRWLDQAINAYNPILTAYNLNFDLSKCRNTGIDLTGFSKSFCLWNTSFAAWGHTKPFLNMVLETHAFNNRTEHGNLTFKTNAETMARFVLGDAMLEDEPHTALEDAVFYELPILVKLLKAKSTKWILNNTVSYNWRECLVRDWFQPVSKR